MTHKHGNTYHEFGQNIGLDLASSLYISSVSFMDREYILPSLYACKMKSLLFKNPLLSSINSSYKHRLPLLYDCKIESILFNNLILSGY